MKISLIYLGGLVIVITVFSACASIDNKALHKNQIPLNPMNRYRIDGTYRVGSIPTESQSIEDLSWFIFDRDPYKRDSIDRLAIACIDNHRLMIAQYNDSTIVRTREMKGKFKDGYFYFRRKSNFIPAIVVNVFRNRAFRIGLLENGNLVGDYEQISVGTIWFIFPAREVVKRNRVEFERIASINRGI